MMKTFKKALVVTLALTMILTSMSSILGVVSAEAPISSWNLKGNLDSVNVNELIAADKLLSSATTDIKYINNSAKGNASQIYIREENEESPVLGLAAGTKYLELGISKLTNTATQSYTFMDFQHPVDATAYPVTSISGKSYIYSNGNNGTNFNGGVGFVIGKNIAEDGTVKYLSTGISLHTSYTQGTAYATAQPVFLIGAQTALTGTALTPIAWNGRANAQQLVDNGWVVNDEGDALTNEQNTALVDYFATLTNKNLTLAEQAFDFTVSPDASGETVNITVSFASLPGYSDIAIDMPNAINIKYSVKLSHKSGSVTTAYDPYVGAVGYFNGTHTGATKSYFSDITVNYDTSSYVPPVEKNYNPEIKGATIRREGTQTLAFRCAIGDIREDVAIAEYGMIVTANSYINENRVSLDDLKVGTENKLVQVVSSKEVEALEKGYEFTANIGNIANDYLGVRYVAVVYVKYADGTIDYSKSETKSVISVAKAIISWVFENKDKAELAGLSTPITDIITNVAEDGTITYAYDVTTDNGVSILKYLETNNEVISEAYNALNAQ